MKLFLGFLLLATFKTVLSNNSNNGKSETSTSSVKSNQISNNTIIHHTLFDTTLNHLVVDRNTGRVFIGGVNRLYQLSPDLEIQALAITGPRNDSTDCTALECTKTDTIRTLIDNYNKVLLIDYSTSRLITTEVDAIDLVEAGEIGSERFGFGTAIGALMILVVCFGCFRRCRRRRQRHCTGSVELVNFDSENRVPPPQPTPPLPPPLLPPPLLPPPTQSPPVVSRPHNFCEEHLAARRALEEKLSVIFSKR